MCMFCRSLFVLLSFFFWLLWFFFVDLWILITPLVSLNSSEEGFVSGRCNSSISSIVVGFFYLNVCLFYLLEILFNLRMDYGIIGYYYIYLLLKFTVPINVIYLNEGQSPSDIGNLS